MAFGQLGSELSAILRSPYIGGGSKFPQLFIIPECEQPLRLRARELRKSAFEVASYNFALKDLKPGDIVEIRGPNKKLLAHGFFEPRLDQVHVFDYFSPLYAAQLPLVDEAFWQNRFLRALNLRKRFPQVYGESSGNAAYRLLNGTGDGVPGLYIDVFGQWATVRAESHGAKSLLPVARRFLHHQLNLNHSGNYFSSAADGPSGIVSQSGYDGIPPAKLTFVENNVEFPLPLEVVGMQRSTEADADGVRARLGILPSLLPLSLRAERRLLWASSAGRHVLDVGARFGGVVAACVAGGSSSVVSVQPESVQSEIVSRVLRHQQGSGIGSARLDSVSIVRTIEETNRTDFDIAAIEWSGDDERNTGSFVKKVGGALSRLTPDGRLLVTSPGATPGASVLCAHVAEASTKVGYPLKVIRVSEDAVDFPIVVGAGAMGGPRPKSSVFCTS
jgi:23S rRNA G2069 N7-methylase RlmK/C1962 C5-methylase RlmI